MRIQSLAGDGKAFGSGPDNPHGPRLEFELDQHGAVGRVTFPPKFQGWEGLVHNGLLILALDDAMFFATLNHTDSYSMSVRLKLMLENPVMVDEQLLVKARVVKVDGRKIHTAGEIIKQADNSVLARSEGLFILVKGREQARANESLANIKFSRTVDK